MIEEIIVSLLQLVFIYPGAFLRWFFFYKNKKSIKEVADDDWYKNSFIGILFFASLFGLVYSLQ